MLVTISDRGQITIPSKVRKRLNAKHFEFEFDGENLILKPIQTKDEFMKELDDAYEDYKKNGGHTHEEMMEMFKIGDGV